MMIVKFAGIIEGQVYVYCISSVPLFLVILESEAVVCLRER